LIKMPQRRIVVTGIGIISSLGHNLAEHWSALSEGRSGIARITTVDTTALRFQHGAEVHGFEPEKHFPNGQIDFLDRFAQFALVAARQAVADSGLSFSGQAAERTAVITGCSGGGQSSEDAVFVALYAKNAARVHPLSIPRVMANAAASHISMELGILGPTYNVSTACSSANHAIGQAFWLLRNNQADVALAGGAEAPFSFGMLKAWEALRVVSPDTCRPFSKGRQGMVLGEGAAILVLEEKERAVRRGARIYGEIVGFGMSSDAGHLTAPGIEGPARAMKAALLDAGFHPEQIDYINAHGTGTAGNDPAETMAIRQVFGPYAEKLAVSSTKSMHGHALGAAGALEAAATLMAMKEGIIPPTMNFLESDPQCDLDVVPNQARKASLQHTLSNSFAFGGLNAVIAFQSADRT
jgi:nodulation protein E